MTSVEATTMEGENTAPLLNNNVGTEKALQKHCCNGQCGGESPTKIVPVQQTVCAGAKPCRTKRPSASDSGCGSLDPISEHQECLSDECGKKVVRRPSSLQIPSAPRCNHCDSIVQQTNECWSKQSQRHDEMQCSANGGCIHIPKSHSFGSQGHNFSCSSVDPQNTRFKNGRNRTPSESYTVDSMSANSEAVFLNGRSECLLMKADIENPEKRPRRCCKYSLIAVAFVLLLMSIAGTALAIYFASGSKMKAMEEEIKALKESTTSGNQVPRAVSDYVRQNGEDRPRTHMLLKGERSIQPDQWNRKVLQWIPFIGENEGFVYDDKTRCLEVQQDGVYFVYNQIYAFRRISEPVEGMRNHTIFHAIFKKPFNFPSHMKPMLVAESALSNCWNENAQTQVHTSYQGIIVKLQEKDRIFVGLEDFNESFDTLRTDSTFFGAFKL